MRMSVLPVYDHQEKILFEGHENIHKNICHCNRCVYKYMARLRSEQIEKFSFSRIKLIYGNYFFPW